MNRPLALAVVGAALAGALIWFLFLRGGDVPVPAAPPPDLGQSAVPEPVGAVQAQAPDAGRPAEAAVRREAAPTGAAAAEEDPEIRAALSGFRGRVVDHKTQPVAECGVKLLRFSLDKAVGALDFMEGITIEPQWLAGESITREDGTFVIEGVWPRALFLLHAGIGTDAPTHSIVQRVPGPGEIVDLGDVVLQDAAVVTGIVVDENGDPVVDALVRGADLPGQLVGLFPFERFDPRGYLLIREPRAPFQVLAMPSWVERAFESLPIPATRTGVDGRFRLGGLVPGSNLVATTKPGLLGDVRPSVMLKAGQVKDLGRIRLKSGEELLGRVIDTAGKPVVGAEVVAGGTLAMAPVDLASFVGLSNDEGRFRGVGFPDGRVTAAARRGPGHPWVLADPQSLLGEVVVTLPATLSLLLTITTADNVMVAEPRLKIFCGDNNEGTLEMSAMGFLPPVDLEGRLERLEDGRLRVNDLLPGRYTILASAVGSAVAKGGVELQADGALSLILPARRVFQVQVVNAEGKGIRSAEIFGKESGRDGLVDMPVSCGRTNAEGRLEVDEFHAETVRLSALHPRYGAVHAEARSGLGEIVMRMLEPGSIEGVVTEEGRPATHGKWTIAVQQRGGTRGALQDTPQLVAPGTESTFTVRGLQPGSYRLEVMDSLDALTSPGGVFGLAQQSMFRTNSVRETVEVQSGLVSHVALETTPARPVGPAGQVSGTVIVDGRPGSGYALTGWVQNDERGGRSGGRLVAKVEENGRFDLGVVPVGTVRLTLTKAQGLFERGETLWSSNFELAEGELKVLQIDLQTSWIEGQALMPDGSPAANARVSASGWMMTEKGRGDHLWRNTMTDAAGRFRFEQLPAGEYEVRVDSASERRARGTVAGLKVLAGQPVTGVQVNLAATATLSGRADLAVFGDKKPEWIWVSLVTVERRTEPDGSSSMNFNSQHGDSLGREGNFSIDGVTPGTYRAQFHWNREEGHPSELWHRDPIIVGSADLTNVVLIPVNRQQAGIDQGR